MYSFKDVYDDYTRQSFVHHMSRCLCGILMSKLVELPTYREKLKQCAQKDKIRSYDILQSRT